MVVDGTATQLKLTRWIQDTEFVERNRRYPARHQGPDGRKYYTPLGYFPSVTTIREGTKSEAAQLKLVNWSKKNPGAKEAAGLRGTHIHLCAEMHVTGQPYEVDPQYEKFWTGMPDVLDQFEKVIWAEKPLNGDFSWTVGSDDIARVWGYDTDQETGEIRGWAGAPDLIGIANGKVTLADYKTSNTPYCRYFPDKALQKEDPDEFRKQMLGWMKYKSCCVQLSAYDMGIEETLGIKLDQAVVIACVEELEKPQIFKLSRTKLDYLRLDWLKMVRKYYEMYPAPNQDHPTEELPIAA